MAAGASLHLLLRGRGAQCCILSAIQMREVHGCNFFFHYYLFNPRVLDKISGILSLLKGCVNILANSPIAIIPIVISVSRFPLIISGCCYEIQEVHCVPPMWPAPCPHHEIIMYDYDAWNKCSKLVLWLKHWAEWHSDTETAPELIGFRLD